MRIIVTAEEHQMAGGMGVVSGPILGLPNTYENGWC